MLWISANLFMEKLKVSSTHLLLRYISKTTESNTLNKLKMVEEELDETAHWLELVIDSEMIERNRLESLHEENLELLKIITRSIITMREKINKA